MLEIIEGELRLCQVCARAYRVTKSELETEAAIPGIFAAHDTCTTELIKRYLTSPHNTPKPLKKRIKVGSAPAGALRLFPSPL